MRAYFACVEISSEFHFQKLGAAAVCRFFPFVFVDDLRGVQACTGTQGEFCFFEQDAVSGLRERAFHASVVKFFVQLGDDTPAFYAQDRPEVTSVMVAERAVHEFLVIVPVEPSCTEPAAEQHFERFLFLYIGGDSVESLAVGVCDRGDVFRTF